MNTTASSRHRRNISPFLADRHVRRFRFSRHSRGFTIVELLIVVVIIAILAAITLVTYNGIQQRANNAAIIDAASKSLRMIQAYIAANDKYPLTSGSACITSGSGCQLSGGIIAASTTFDTAIATVGTLPRKIPMDSSTDRSGILYTYTSTRTVDGTVQPALLFYWLYGVAQQCGLTGVVKGWAPSTSTSDGYSAANDASTSKTLCYITIPGPAS